MSAREFTDSKGMVWRVWDVKPTHLHPVTKSEEYMEPWAGGWLTFESEHEKRRLVQPYPARWADYDLPQLEMLCRAAEPVGAKRKETESGQHLAITEDAAKEAEAADVERSFTSRRGQKWVARLHERPGDNGALEAVLRFTSGDCVLDLTDWPSDWRDLDAEGFAALVLDAQPPRALSDNGGPRRRREDRPSLN